MTDDVPKKQQRELLISRQFNMCSMCQMHPSDDYPFAYALWSEGGPRLFCCQRCAADGQLADFVQWATTLAVHDEFSGHPHADWPASPLLQLAELFALSWPIGLSPDAAFEFVDLLASPPKVVGMRRYMRPPYLDPDHPPAFPNLMVDGTMLTLPEYLLRNTLESF